MEKRRFVGGLLGLFLWSLMVFGISGGVFADELRMRKKNKNFASKDGKVKND